MRTVYAHELRPGDVIFHYDTPTGPRTTEVDFADTMPNGDIRVDGYDDTIGMLRVDMYLMNDLVNLL